jgi:cyclase
MKNQFISQHMPRHPLHQLRSLFIVLAAATLFAFSPGAMPKPRHFTFYTLQPGVYAAIANPDGHAISNAGIVDMGSYLLVFDAFMTPHAAREMRNMAEAFCGKPVRYLINSHWHNDHTGGNQVFGDATILGTEEIRMAMREKLPDEVNSYPGFAPQTARTMAEMDIRNFNTFDSLEHILWLSYFSGIAESMDSLRITMADSIIKLPFTLESESRRVLFLHAGNGHTTGDLVMWLPAEQILFAGDLVFSGYHPWLGDGDSESLISGLNSLEQLKPKQVVPGHGPIGGPESIQTMRAYVDSVRSIANNARRLGLPADSLNTLPVPEPFGEWHLKRFFTPNIRLSYSK